MPIYEYQCADCGQSFEFVQKMSEEPLVRCPECGEAALKKIISAPAFHLKGTGWYVTDFKNQSKTNAEAKENNPTAAKATAEKETVKKEAVVETKTAEPVTKKADNAEKKSNKAD